MASLKIFALCFLSSVLILWVDSSPINDLHTMSRKYYQMVPLTETRRIKRDIALDSTDRVPAKATETDEQKGTTTNKDMTEPLSSHSVALFEVVRRRRRAQEDHNRYADSDHYYDDSDYAGYDRKGSDVGYMEDNDDFPTVVW